MAPSTSPNLRLVRSPLKEPKKVESVLDLIGDTPLLRLRKLSEECGLEILGKFDIGDSQFGNFFSGQPLGPADMSVIAGAG